MPELKDLQAEFGSLVRDVKSLQDEKSETQETKNKLRELADAMDAKAAEIEAFSENKATQDRISRHMQSAQQGAGRVPITFGDNADAAPGEYKDGWLQVLDQKSGRMVPVFNRDVLTPGTPAYRKELAASTRPEYKDVFTRYLRGQQKFMNAEELTLLNQGSMELKALSEGTNTGGGFAVPVDFLPELIQRLPGQAEFTQDCRHVTTNRDTVVAPRIKANASNPAMYPSAIVGTWVSENPSAATGQVQPVWEQVSITVNTAKLETILSKNFVSDSAVNIGSYLTEGFSLASLLQKDQAYLVGTGLAQPTGASVTSGINSVTSKQTNAMSGDDPKELLYQTYKQYWTGGKFYLSRDCLRQIRELKDGNGNYLWSPGYDHGMDGGVPAMIEGIPYAVTDFLPTAATGHIPMFFGNPKFYWAVDRLEMSIQVLNELYAESNEIAYLAFFRTGGSVVVPEAFTALTIA